MRLAARIALLAWLAFVLAITLSPHNNATQAGGDQAVATAKRNGDLPKLHLPPNVRRNETDIIGNVLLFIPLGFFGVLAFPDRRRAVIWAGISLSASIELIQLGYLPHRTASLRDIATNSTGHLIGVAAAVVVSRVVAVRRQG